MLPLSRALPLALGLLLALPFQLPRVIILIESYDELSAAADRGVGELRLMTLGNQGSSELQKGRNRNRDPPSPNRDEDPCLGSEDPPQLREELPRTNTLFYSALYHQKH